MNVKFSKLKNKIKGSNKSKNASMVEGDSGKESKNAEGYIELSEKPSGKQQASIILRYCVLDEFGDVKPIMDWMRDGYSICMVKIKILREKDINELKRAIAKIKRVADVMGGDVIGMDEDYLIVTPSFVKVQKTGSTKGLQDGPTARDVKDI